MFLLEDPLWHTHRLDTHSVYILIEINFNIAKCLLWWTRENNYFLTSGLIKSAFTQTNVCSYFPWLTLQIHKLDLLLAHLFLRFIYLSVC